MMISSQVRGMSSDQPTSRSDEPLPPLPPRPRIPPRHGEAVAESGNGGGGGSADFEEQNFYEREYWKGGIASSDGIFWMPAIKTVKGKYKVVLKFADPDKKAE